MKLVKKINSNIPVLDMKDGDIAVIKSWPGSRHLNNRYIGDIVQRYGSHLVLLGESRSKSWPEFFHNPTPTKNGTVQILPTGTQIEI